MTKVLNLDDLETALEKSLVIKGVEYKMKPFSVEEFINQMKEVEKISEEDMTGVQLFEMSLRMVRRAFPGLTDEIISQLNTAQVDAIYEFLKSKVEEEADRGASEGN